MASKKQKKELSPEEIEEFAVAYSALAKDISEVAKSMREKGLKNATFRGIATLLAAIKSSNIAVGYFKIGVQIADIEKAAPAKKKR